MSDEHCERKLREILSRFDVSEHTRLVPLRGEGQELAAKLCGGKKPDYSTLWRWSHNGTRGASSGERIVLETVRGIECLTCLVWLARFLVDRGAAQKRRLARGAACESPMNKPRLPVKQVRRVES
ncbi:MAG TPA: hypothetical protein PKA88_30125 [Polyangiaceae bacterium]|nr:hypothetical protein [Polyangiaceae bacterium]HMR75826.1 hypothetical protein [Polyangiaceae bacterium]